MFLNGIGLDQEAFLPFLELISLPSVRLTYPYKTFAHVAPTVPGFEPTEDLASEGLLSMNDQADFLAEVVRARVAELGPQEIVLYSFSYGSDLMVPLLARLAEDRTIMPRLRRLVLAEINVSTASCFITSRIAQALEGVRAGAGEWTLRGAHAHFFGEVLRAYTVGDISKTLLADLAAYFSVIITKNWYQLAFNCREVTTSPEGRIRKLLGTLKWLPHTELDLIFSDAADRSAFKELFKRWNEGCRNVRVFDASAHEHFHHMDKDGILKNLARTYPEG